MDVFRARSSALAGRALRDVASTSARRLQTACASVATTSRGEQRELVESGRPPRQGINTRLFGESSSRAFSTSTVCRAQGSSTSSSQKACAKCGTAAQMNALSCDNCGALQPLPSELDAYELLDLDSNAVSSNGWDVDPAQLKAQWRKRVALSHPDRMGGKDEKEQKIAEQQSALINKAFETLREPLQRAHLLLEKHASSAPSEAESLEDPEVLMEVMELRENLEDAASEDDAEAVRVQNEEHLNETIATLRSAFAKTPPDVETARKAAVGLRYWTNIDKAAREWQPGKRVELQH